MKKTGLSILLAASVFTGTACQSTRTTEGGAVGVDRKQRMGLVSQADAENAANQQYRQALAAAEDKGVLNKDTRNLSRLRAVANRLVAQTRAFRQDAPSWQWEVNLESNDQLNAYCAPGGKIMFYTGLINKLNLTDDELAAIMGHEMAHALREHSREAMSQQMTQQLLLGGLAIATKAKQNQVDMAQTALAVTLTLPNSRENEAEADKIGLELAARAGYNPNAALSLWAKMSDQGGGEPPPFLSTHPSHASRSDDIRAQLPKVMPLYEAAKQGRR